MFVEFKKKFSKNMYFYWRYFRYMADHPTVRTFPKKDIWMILKTAIHAYTTAEDNIRAGFRVTGIYPLDEEALLNRK